MMNVVLSLPQIIFAVAFFIIAIHPDSIITIRGVRRSIGLLGRIIISLISAYFVYVSYIIL